MLMDARLFLCQGFALLRNPNSIYWDDDAEYVPSCSGLLHLAQPGAGEDVAFWNTIRFFFVHFSCLSLTH